MSNRQNHWDEKQVKDRVSPREDAQADKQQAQQLEAENSQHQIDENDDRWIPPGNSDQGSRK